ncbi:hypothetical protein BG011_001704, partial [Mortierella polycephala]
LNSKHSESQHIFQNIFSIQSKTKADTLRGMQPKAIIAFLACLCLAFRADAFWDFGNILRITSNTLEGVGSLVHGLFGGFTAEELGFKKDPDFKAKILSVNALCMTETSKGQRKAAESCKDFGKKYFETPGTWDCGRLRSEQGNWSCLFRPSGSVRQGFRFPEVVFRGEEW